MDIIRILLELAEKPQLCIFRDSSSSSDSDSDWYKLEETRHKRTRILNYVKITVPKYSFTEFRQHFRVSTEIAEMLTGKYANNVNKNYLGGWPEVSHRKAVLIGLWYLSNTETYRQISDRFNISLSTAHQVVGLLVDCLLKCKTSYIKWPTQNEARNISHVFKRKGGFRNTLGAIDGCHFRIRKPIHDGDDYINRKVHPSIILQGVVDYKKKIIDVSVGYPGSLHDARVLRKSKLFLTADTKDIFYKDYFLLGDSAYPSLKWLVTPFRDNGHLSNNEVAFNLKHSRSRIIVEHSFGILKGRFRRLHEFQNLSSRLITKFIVAACILHNICIMECDFGEDFIETVEDMEDEDTNSTGNIDRRQELLNEMSVAERN